MVWTKIILIYDTCVGIGPVGGGVSLDVSKTLKFYI